MKLEDYIALIPNWNANRPKFVNTVAALVRPMCEAMALLEQLATVDFDLDQAIGNEGPTPGPPGQLDRVGEWIGRTRWLTEPISGVYFSFDIAGVGFDQGTWEGVFDPIHGPRLLDDKTYRSVLQLQAIANSWDGTLPSIKVAFEKVFPGVMIDDRGDKLGELMTMNVLVPQGQLSALLMKVLSQDFMLKPSGVRVNVFETTALTVTVFGFDIDDAVIGGFDHGVWWEETFIQTE